MNRFSSLFIILTLTFQVAQTGERWWIFFDAKPNSPAVSSARMLVSERSLVRRAKVMPHGNLTDRLDLPVDPAYVREISALGARVHAASRWLNAVSVEADARTLEAIRRLPFVARVQRVGVARHTPQPISMEQPGLLRKTGATDDLSYGPSLMQNTTLNALPLHALGVIGHGAFVGMLDDGYNSYRTHPALRTISVAAAYDFTEGDTIVAIEQKVPQPTQGYHGAATLSVLAGYDPGSLIGPAYGATLALAKTEVDSVEIIAEEDHYVEGIEWLDSLGVDIISSSLGYIDWYSYPQLDGQTAITTLIARTLAARGILLVTAMGNEGNYQPGGLATGTLIAPSDADSILSVGAVGPAQNPLITRAGFLTSFSSTGPTADGRIKPDVVAQGSVMLVANWYNPNDWYNPTGYYYSQGTSFSTPMTAAAAALVVSAHPEATAMQVRDALKHTAIQFDDLTSRTTSFPNNFYGWGQVDAYAAALSLGPVVSNIPLVRYAVVGNEPSLIISIRAASNAVLDMSRFAVFARRSTDTTFTRYPLAAGSESGLYIARIPVSGPSDTSYVGYITFAEQSAIEQRRPVGTALFELTPTSDSLAALFPPMDRSEVPTSYTLQQNYPNPFNAGTAIVFQAPQPERVELAVYNLLGQKVRTLFAGIARTGANTLTWPEARDDQGRTLSTGVYILRLSTPASQHALKMVLLK